MVRLAPRAARRLAPELGLELGARGREGGELRGDVDDEREVEEAGEEQQVAQRQAAGGGEAGHVEVGASGPQRLKAHARRVQPVSRSIHPDQLLLMAGIHPAQAGRRSGSGERVMGSRAESWERRVECSGPQHRKDREEESRRCDHLARVPCGRWRLCAVGRGRRRLRALGSFNVAGCN